MIPKTNIEKDISIPFSFLIIFSLSFLENHVIRFANVIPNDLWKKNIAHYSFFQAFCIATRSFSTTYNKIDLHRNIYIRQALRQKIT